VTGDPESAALLEDDTEEDDSEDDDSEEDDSKDGDLVRCNPRLNRPALAHIILPSEKCSIAIFFFKVQNTIFFFKVQNTPGVIFN
jgi:hypothetical protein